jgi:hypothetical protein
MIADNPELSFSQAGASRGADEDHGQHQRFHGALRFWFPLN